MKFVLALLAGLIGSPALAGSLALMGAGPATPAGCTESAAFLARVAAQDATHTTAYQNLICGLVTDGIWSKLDAIYMLKANESATALTNLKSATYNLTNNSATFSANAYYAGNGSTAYLETGFNPSSASSPNFVQNSASIFAWSTLTTVDTGGIIGQANGTGATQLLPRYTGDILYSRANQSTDNSTANTDGSGFYVLSRTSSTAMRMERNGSLVATYSVASATPRNQSFTILYAAAYFQGRASAAGFGSGLTQTEMGNLYTRVNTYMGAF
jgi:hypothetical protein